MGEKVWTQESRTPPRARSPTPKSSRSRKEFLGIEAGGPFQLLHPAVLGYSLTKGAARAVTKDPTHRPPLNSRPNSQPTGRCSLVGSQDAEVAVECGLYPAGRPRGPPGQHPRPAGRGHLGPSRRQRQEAEDPSGGTMARKKQIKSLNCGVSLHTHQHAYSAV